MYNYNQSSFSSQASTPPSLEIRHGHYFNYVVPSGWRVVEDGQFAVVLFSPDNTALTIMVGNSGLPVNYNPWQFVYEKLLAMQPYQLQMGQPRQVQPIAGCTVAYEWDYNYMYNGIAYQGIAKCSIAYSYNLCTMVMTCAASDRSQWANYVSWLPQIASEVSATNGAAFGIQGIMAQNINISLTEGQRHREYREWSQNTWNEVNRQRNESIDRQNFQFRENLGNVTTWTNPYGYPMVELPTNYNYYWINRQGQIYGTNDPTENPNFGSTQDWLKMNRYLP
ncbi:hypothetical protein I8752_06755 [Nostocaceae cyanobacterium CENA369]|uniref:Uncharacterized protein n=1 Tax=Dendronalium phyllosphericum CENA369 TaxID=1725256 RepID=A0A8J7HYN0_9NOST|nr:hypothetical protein [Dendronalium phyllosphericum]MBH8572716.1 hypothetical protein [Dendronalium phyllosphericum CENA369]